MWFTVCNRVSTGKKVSFVILGIDEGYIGQAEKLLLEIKDMTDENSEAVLSLSRFYENMLKTGMWKVIDIFYFVYILRAFFSHIIW